MWALAKADCAVAPQVQVFHAFFPLIDPEAAWASNLHSAPRCSPRSKSSDCELAQRCWAPGRRLRRWTQRWNAVVTQASVCVCVFLPSARGSLRDSAVELSSRPSFAQRQPQGLPVWGKKGQVTVFPFQYGWKAPVLHKSHLTVAFTWQSANILQANCAEIGTVHSSLLSVYGFRKTDINHSF